MLTPEPSSEFLVLALGSNLGDRMASFRAALTGLEVAGICPKAVSSVVETPPIGYLQQPPFLNMVALATTDLPPQRVLSIFHSVEAAAGRTRDFPDAPRPLDLDLLFFKGKILREEGLHVPHPRWKERSFVVVPLAEICPTLRDPETGWQVHEVARFWPSEPQEIRVVEGREAFEKAWVRLRTS